MMPSRVSASPLLRFAENAMPTLEKKKGRGPGGLALGTGTGVWGGARAVVLNVGLSA